MAKTFKYSILQYVHSELLGERINIGLIVFFPFDNNHTAFVFPEHLKRLKSVYPDLNEKKIKYFLETINDKINNKDKLERLHSTNFNIDDDFFRFIDTEILKIDDSALQFSSLYESLLYTDNKQQIVNDLYLEFFNYYTIKSKPKPKYITESTITSRFINDLSSRLNNFDKKVKRNVTLGKADFKYTFDAQWQNGTTNYVKAVSFDIATANAIQQKSVNLFGSLSLLNGMEPLSNNRYDLIIAKPTLKSVFKDYDRALNIIDKAQVNKSIIEFDKLDAYTNQAIDYLSK